METRLAGIIGSAVRSQRNKLGLTQADVAERVGIATEVYGRLERGHMLPSVRTLRKLCLVLNCSSDVLMGLTANSPDVVAQQESDDSAINRIAKRMRELDPKHISLVGQMVSALKRTV